MYRERMYKLIPVQKQANRKEMKRPEVGNCTEKECYKLIPVQKQAIRKETKRPEVGNCTEIVGSN